MNKDLFLSLPERNTNYLITTYMGKITVKHYLNKRLKPEIDGNRKYYPLYVSITVNQRNIRKRSAIYLTDFTEKEFENKKSEAYLPFADRLDYEINLLKHITEKFVDDYNNNRLNKDIISHWFNRNKSKDKFINLLNIYIDYYSHSMFNSIEYSLKLLIREEIFVKLQNVFIFDKMDTADGIFEIVGVPFSLGAFIKNNLSTKCFERYYIVEALSSLLSKYCIKTGYDLPLIDWIDGKIQPSFKSLIVNSTIFTRNSKLGTVTEEKANEYINVIDEIIKSHFIEYSELYLSTLTKNYI